MSNKAIWWSNKVWFPTKKAALKEQPDYPVVSLNCPGYCDPTQLALFLNKLDKSYFT